MATGKIILADDIEISFPYSAKLVAAVKELPQRRWNGESRVWTLPRTRIHAALVVQFAEAHNFDVDEEVALLAKQTNGAADADFSFLPSPPKARTVKIDGDRAVICFPFNADLVEQVKKIPGRAWNKDLMAWTVPTTILSLTELERFLELNDFTGEIERISELSGKTAELQAEAIEASKAASADFEVEGLGGTLRPFQKAGVKYAVEKKRVIIGDEMGLGKTVEALAVLKSLDAFPALVMCPATLRLNWYKETRIWLQGKSIQMLGADAFGRSDAALTIINYDRLKNYRDYLVKRNFKAVICDESHVLKNAKAQRTIYVEEVVNGVIYSRHGSGKADRKNKERFRAAADVRLLLTGTPVLNRPNELVSQLQILDRLAEFGGWYGFMRDFCSLEFTRFGIDTSGNANLKRLNDQLRATCYVRRTKAEVLKELPPKQRTIVPTELSNRTEYERAEADLIAWLKATQGAEKAEKAQYAEQLVRIEALKQLAARGKMAAIKEWVEDFLETGEKLVLFGWHQEIVRDLAKTFQCDAIHGGTPINARQEIVDRFQTDPTVKAISLNVQTGGVGITLTAASNVVFCELGWNPATMDQAADRTHRIGQKDSVTEWWFIGRKTIDEDIQELIEAKRAVVDAATDGEAQVSDVSVLSELVARLRGDHRESGESRSRDQEGPLELF